MRWGDIGAATPTLSAAVEREATGSLVVRSLRDQTCPVDGWLAVSAGRRAADTAAPPAPTDLAGCRVPHAQIPLAGGPGTVTGWDTFRAQTATGKYDADPGLLGAQLEAAGVPRAAVGPGAVLAMADRSGRAPVAWPGVPTGPGGTIDPWADAAEPANQVKAALARGARFVAVDLGAVRNPGVAAVIAEGGTAPATRREQLAALDTRLRLVRAVVPTTATVIVASLADDGTHAHLQVLFASGPGFPAGSLRSTSTRQDALVQSTDLLATVMTALGLPAPAQSVGAPITPTSRGDAAARLRTGLDLDEASIALEQIVAPFFLGYGVLELLVLGLLSIVAVRGGMRGGVRTGVRTVARRRALTGLRIGGVGFALVPVATFLANLWPWWRSSTPLLPFTVAVLAATVPLVGLAFAGPWRRPLLGVAGAAGLITAAVVTADLATGSWLALLGLIGGQPLIAGRFYGLGNPTFALFATGLLFAALALAERMLAAGRSRRAAALAVGAVGLAASVIDAAPGLGADFGGQPALVPAFGLLALWVAGVRVTWRRLAAIGGVTIALLVTAAVADWLRPADRRTHLGRFVQEVLDGAGGPVVLRKFGANLDMLMSTPLTMTIPLAAVLIVMLLRRPGRWGFGALQRAYDRQPLLPLGLAALGVLLGLGFLANDSGTSIPPAALMILAPLLFTIAARATELDDAERADARQDDLPRVTTGG